MDILQELPRDLFDYGILYRYVNESATTSIGFYYSTIRDYLLACEVQRLQECTAAVRMTKLNRMYRTYVGESGAIYYSRTGSSEERRDCLGAAYETDLIHHGSQVVRLLAWDGGALVGELNEVDREKLLIHLETLLFADEENRTIADQALDILTRLGMDGGVEEALVRWLCRFGDMGGHALVLTSHRIAGLLGTVDTPAQTERLVALAIDSAKDGYVRRYAIEALSGRSVPDGRAVFLKLIRDPDPNVRAWIRGWYGGLEDEALRGEVFEMLRGGDLAAGAREDVARALGRSRLPYTGHLVFEWFMSLGEGDDELLGWVCRTLAWLDYRPAIPEFVLRLKRQPRGRLAELLLLCLEEMRAEQALPDLLKLLDAEQAESPGTDWARLTFLAQAISSLLDEKSLAIAMAEPRKQGLARYVFTMACAMSGLAIAESTTLSFVLDSTVPVLERVSVLQELGESIKRDPRRRRMIVRERGSRADSEHLRNALYKLLREHSVLSPVALRFLIDFEDDVDRLAGEIMRELPHFRHPIDGHETSGNDPHRLAVVGELLRPWLSRQLESPRTPVVVMQSCSVLAGWVGDDGTWEAVQANRAAVEAAIGEYSLKALEHRLRSGPPRLGVDRLQGQESEEVP